MSAMGRSRPLARTPCGVLGYPDTRYRSIRPRDTELRGWLRDLANDGRRFSYWRLSILLHRQGERSGINRVYRLYREEGLTVRARRWARRRAVGARAPILAEDKVNTGGRSISCTTRGSIRRLATRHPRPMPRRSTQQALGCPTATNSAETCCSHRAESA